MNWLEKETQKQDSAVMYEVEIPNFKVAVLRVGFDLKAVVQKLSKPDKKKKKIPDWLGAGESDAPMSPREKKYWEKLDREKKEPSGLPTSRYYLPENSESHWEEEERDTDASLKTAEPSNFKVGDRVRTQKAPNSVYIDELYGLTGTIEAGPFTNAQGATYFSVVLDKEVFPEEDLGTDVDYDESELVKISSVKTSNIKREALILEDDLKTKENLKAAFEEIREEGYSEQAEKDYPELKGVAEDTKEVWDGILAAVDALDPSQFPLDDSDMPTTWYETTDAWDTFEQGDPSDLLGVLLELREWVESQARSKKKSSVKTAGGISKYELSGDFGTEASDEWAEREPQLREAIKKVHGRLIYFLTDFGTVGDLPVVGLIMESPESPEYIDKVFSSIPGYDDIKKEASVKTAEDTVKCDICGQTVPRKGVAVSQVDGNVCPACQKDYEKEMGEPYEPWPEKDYKLSNLVIDANALGVDLLENDTIVDFDGNEVSLERVAEIAIEKVLAGSGIGGIHPGGLSEKGDEDEPATPSVSKKTKPRGDTGTVGFAEQELIYRSSDGKNEALIESWAGSSGGWTHSKNFSGKAENELEKNFPKADWDKIVTGVISEQPRQSGEWDKIWERFKEDYL